MISALYSIPKEEFLEKLNESVSIREFFDKVGFSDVGRSRDIFFRIIKEYGFDKELEELRERTKIFLNKKTKETIKKHTLPDEQVFCEHSTINREKVKKRIIQRKLIEYKCSCCGISEYNGKPIVLQLHHINGIRDDNRLENLTLLCPNCHSQTDNYSGRGRNFLQNQEKEKQEKIRKELEEKEKQEKEEQKKIRKALKEKENNDLIIKRRESLNNINLFEFGWVTKIAKKWKVSRTQVKRWIKKYCPGLEYLDSEPTGICSVSSEERIKFIEAIDKSKEGWISKAAKEWGVTSNSVKNWLKKYWKDFEYYRQKNIQDKKTNKQKRFEDMLNTGGERHTGWADELSKIWETTHDKAKHWINDNYKEFEEYKKTIDKKDIN